ncbi:unnamed protein product [Ixodes hexagonus]
MALSALDKAYADEIRAIDKRIEETLQEIDTFLKNGSQKSLPKHGAVSSDSETQTRRDQTRVVRVSLQKVLQLCHDEPDSIQVVFQLVKSLAASASLVPFQAPVDCAACIRRLKERDRNIPRNTSNLQANDNTKAGDTTMTTAISRSTNYSLEPDNGTGGINSRENTANVRHVPGLTLETEPIEDVKVLWRCVCYHLADYIFRSLTSANLFLSLNDSLVKRSRWEGYFEVLRATFVPTQVRRIHQSVRTEQLRRFECSCDEVTCLSCLSEFCIRGLVEDVSFLCVGQFCPMVITWRELQAPYIARMRDHVALLLRELSSSSLQTSRYSGAAASSSQASDKAATRSIDNIPKLLRCLANPNVCSSDNEDVERRAKQADGKLVIFENMSLKARIATRKRESRKRASLPTLVKQQSSSSNVEDADDVGGWLSVATVGLVEELHWFERQLNCVFNVDSYAGSGDILSGHPFAMASNSPEESPGQDSDDDDCKNNACFWDWRGLLASSGVLTLLQRSIQDDILVGRKALAHRGWESTEMADVCGSCVKVTALASQAVAQLERYSRAASASRAALSPFRASFSHAVHVRADEALGDVESILAEKHNVPGALAVALNTALYLAEAVAGFSADLAGGGKPKEANDQGANGELHGVQQRADRAASSAEMQLSLHHLKWLSGCVAQDASSHHWNSRGVFQEAGGSRASFTVQAWHLYLQGLRSDLFRDLPPDRARRLLAGVLAQTLEQESLRYAGLRPCEQRLPQLVADVGTLLLCAYDALFAVSTTPGQVLGRCRQRIVNFQDQADEAGPIEAVHSHCTALLATLCVVTAPLEAVYRDFKCGYPEASPSSDLQAGFSPWLAWARPGLFQWPPWARLLPSVTIWVPVALCLASPRPDPQLIVRSFTAENCTLSTMLTAEAATLSTSADREDLECIRRFVDGTLVVLVHSDHLEHSIGDVLLTIVKKQVIVDGWRHFDSSSLAKESSDRPWWYLSLQGLLEEYLESVVASSAPTILKLCSEDEQQWVRQAENEVLQGSSLENVADKMTGAACLTELLSCAMAVVPTFPTPLLTCLTLLDLIVHQAGVRPTNNSAGLQVVLSTLYDILKSEARLCRVFGTQLEPRVMAWCSSLADQLAATALHRGDGAVTGGRSRTTGKLQKAVLSCLGSLGALFSANGDRSPLEEGIQGSPRSETADDINIHLATQSILEVPGGQEALDHLHAVLCTNEGWIRHSLAIPPLLSQTGCHADVQLADAHRVAAESAGTSQGSGSSAKTLNLNVQRDAAGKQGPRFNPAESYVSIGRESYSNETLLRFPLRPDRVLIHLADFGVTETNFRLLLFNRWEFQPGAHVPPEHEKAVKVLQTLYGPRVS